MPAASYRAVTENGHRVIDPPADALCTIIQRLDHDADTFVLVQADSGAHPHTDSRAENWFALIALLPDGGYEVELCDMQRWVRDVSVEHDVRAIADNLMTWIAGRDHPRRRES